jgi:hypothetical protein
MPRAKQYRARSSPAKPCGGSKFKGSTFKVTLRPVSKFQTFQSFNRCASFKMFREFLKLRKVQITSVGEGAPRHFLPGHVWHITHPSSDEFQSFQPFNRFASFQPLLEKDEGTPSALERPRQTSSDSCTGLTSLAQSLSIGWVIFWVINDARNHLERVGL